MAKIDRVQEVSLELLVPYANNAKKHSDDQVEKIAESIKEFGFLSPCLIDTDYNIIAGHGRVMAARKLGLETVPCVFVEGLSEAQRRAYILADNKLTEMGEWDDDLIQVELQALQDMDFNIDLTGFELIEDEEAPKIIEDDYTEEVETRCKLGDVWKLGKHRLICGDSTNLDTIDELMNGDKADMVFTDPPWNVNYGDVEEDNPMGYKNRKILNDCMSTEDFKEFMYRAFSVMSNSSKEGCMTYVVMSAQEWGNMMLALADNDYHWSSTIIWNKDHFVLSRKDYHTKYEPIWYGWKNGSRLCPLEDRAQSDVWDFDRPIRSEEHPTMKPVELVAMAVLNSSKKNNIVLDLFGGSGTTLIACEQTDRICYMSELAPHYCDVIINRWEKLTGEKAEVLK